MRDWTVSFRYVMNHPPTDDEQENLWREFTGVQLCDLVVLADSTDDAGKYVYSMVFAYC